MKTIFRKIGLAGATLMLSALKAAPVAGAVVIANDSTPVGELAAAGLKDIYTGKTAYWPGGQSVIIVVLPDKTDAALKEVSGMDASQFKTFWQRMVFSGRGQQPKKADDVAALIAFVAATKGAIALAPADAALEGVKLVELK